MVCDSLQRLELHTVLLCQVIQVIVFLDSHAYRYHGLATLSAQHERHCPGRRWAHLLLAVVRPRIEHAQLSSRGARDERLNELGQRFLSHAELLGEYAGFAQDFNGGEADEVADELQQAGLFAGLVDEQDGAFADSADLSVRLRSGQVGGTYTPSVKGVNRSIACAEPARTSVMSLSTANGTPPNTVF